MARAKAEHVDLSVARLRTLVDYAPYTPSSAAPQWLSRLSQATAASLGTLIVLAPSGVSIRQPGGRIRPTLDPAAVQMLGLVEAVTRKGVAVGIGLPPDAPHLPLLLAAAEVLSETVSKQLRKE